MHIKLSIITLIEGSYAKNKARSGLSMFDYPYIDYLLVNIC